MDGNGETTIFYVKVWNHPTETTIYKQMFQVPGSNETCKQNFLKFWKDMV